VVNGGQTYNLSYDGENRMSSAGYGNIGYGGVLTNYYYDAQNRRIWSWGNAVDALGNTTSYTVNVYTPGGQKLGAYLFVPGTTNQSGVNVAFINVTISASDQYFGGRRLAVMDQLGSAGTYFPWGEDKGSTNPQDIWSYATYWREGLWPLHDARSLCGRCPMGGPRGVCDQFVLYTGGSGPFERACWQLSRELV
jgi:hypothetical protein